jgi:acetyl esterase/lipase
MSLEMDAQIAAALRKLFETAPEVPPPAPGDWTSLRANVDAILSMIGAARPRPANVVTKRFEARSIDGAAVELRWFTKRDANPGAGVLYIHGGGMIAGSVALYSPLICDYVAQSGVPMLAVDYRLPPEHPHPIPMEDCFAALRWFADHAPELGVERTLIAVMGDSAGAGLAAAMALAARDRGGPALKKQILLYPMLDDRTMKPSPELGSVLTWSYADNATAWRALLGPAVGTDSVSPYAAPARSKALSNLPPAYIDVGELDIFRNEDIDYAFRLSRAGVSTELHVHPGAPHGFDAFAPHADVSRRAWRDRLRVLESIGAQGER